jgi:hypothetical protein
MTNQSTLAQRVAESFAQLTLVASDLNAISDELGKSVARIDFALKNLNVGIPVWISMKSWDNSQTGELDYWTEDIGYAKINGKWGISLRRIDGNLNHEEDANEETWLFGEAPRALRLEAIDSIPSLLEELSTKATVAAQKIQAKLADVQAVADAINPSYSPRTTNAERIIAKNPMPKVL